MLFLSLRIPHHIGKTHESFLETSNILINLQPQTLSFLTHLRCIFFQWGFEVSLPKLLCKFTSLKLFLRWRKFLHPAYLS